MMTSLLMLYPFCTLLLIRIKQSIFYNPYDVLQQLYKLSLVCISSDSRLTPHPVKAYLLIPAISSAIYFYPATGADTLQPS